MVVVRVDKGIPDSCLTMAVMSEDEGHSFDDPGERAFDELGSIHATLETVRSELEEFHSTLKSKSDSRWYTAVVLFILLSEGWSGSKLDRWTDMAWCSMRYGTEFKNITVQRRPADCDFLHVPRGGKNCKYEKMTVPFGDEERKAMMQAVTTTPEERLRYQQMSNSVSVYWNKQEDQF